MFSIIIPVYNTSAYLKKCVNSLLKQDEPNFEIIAIDDGSTDNSKQVLDSIALYETRLRIFSIPNGGQGPARNFGLTKARGQYIAFVDSDDTVASDLLSSVTPHLLDHDIDVVSYAMEFQNEIGRTVAKRGPKTDFHSTGEDIFIDAMLDRNFLTSACNKVYRRKLLEDNSITFPNLRAYEDSVFSRCVALHARKVVYLNKALYYPLVRPGSVSRGMTVNSFSQAEKLIALEKEFYCKKISSIPMSIIFQAHIVRFLSHLIILSAFRIDDPAERTACYLITEKLGFSQYSSNTKVRAHFGFFVKVQIFFARRPKLLRILAVVIRRLGWSPY